MDGEDDNESDYSSGMSRRSSVESTSSFINPLNTTNIDAPSGKERDSTSRFSNSTEKGRGGDVGRLGRGDDIRGATRDPGVGRNEGQGGAKSSMDVECDNESGYSSGVSRRSSVESTSSFVEIRTAPDGSRFERRQGHDHLSSLNASRIPRVITYMSSLQQSKDYSTSRFSNSTQNGRGGEVGRLGRGGDIRGTTRDPGVGRNEEQGGAKRNMECECDNESGYSSGVSRQSSVESTSSFESTSRFANSRKAKCGSTAPDGSRFERDGQENVGWNEAPVPKKTSSRAKDHWNDRSYDCLNQRFPDLKKTTAKEGNPCNICQVPVDEAFVYNSPTRDFQFHGKCLASFTGG